MSHVGIVPCSTNLCRVLPLCTKIKSADVCSWAPIPFPAVKTCTKCSHSAALEWVLVKVYMLKLVLTYSNATGKASELVNAILIMEIKLGMELRTSYGAPCLCCLLQLGREEAELWVRDEQNCILVGQQQ
eukprot:Gb_00605 [translate_table: standard]